jgi:aminopeptidase N
MLRGLLGDEAYFRGLVRFQVDYRFRTATAEDLREEWQAVSGRDLGAYVQSWIRDTTLPTLTWSHQTKAADGGWQTTVEIATADAPGPLPLEVAAELTTTTVRQRMMLPPGPSTYEIRTPEPPRRLRLNDDNGLLVRLKRR